MNFSLECHQTDLEDRLNEVFRIAYVPFKIRPHFRRDGKVDAWGLDMRLALSRHELLLPIAKRLGREIAKLDIRQIVSTGYGGALLCGGIAALMPGFRAGLLREAPKPYGFRKEIEGHLSRSDPIAVVDDILSSGGTAAAAVRRLRQAGFRVPVVATVFNFSWRAGGEVLSNLEVEVITLATVHGPRAQEPR